MTQPDPPENRFDDSFFRGPSEGPEGGEGELQPRPSRSKGRGRRSFQGSEILGGGSSAAILARLLDGDPLDMDGRCFARIRHHAVLVDGDRLYQHATARVAAQALYYEGKPPLARWLQLRIDEVIRILLDEDLQAELDGRPPEGPTDPACGFLIDTLGVEPPLARTCAVVFNNLSIPVRKAFWARVMQDKSLNRAVAEGLGPPAKCEARVRYAMGMMSTLGQWPEPDPDPDAPAWRWEDER